MMKLRQIGHSQDVFGQFSDWNKMSLKSEIKLHEDFVLATDASWSKLVKVFGGGPKIPLSLIDTNG